MIPAAAVVGPTASGKTAFAIELAKKVNGEIVSCDSMQIYKGLDIGTAKPTPEERAAVPHHLIDFLPLEEPFSVSDYVSTAEKIVENIYFRGKLPIVTGGTGLYARSLLSGISFEDDCRDADVRSRLQAEADEFGVEFIHSKLAEVDLQAAERIHANNVKRVIRALEFCIVTGRLFSEQAEISKPAEPKYKYTMFCLSYRNRQVLYDRINRRVEEMLANGLLCEAEKLYKKTESNKPLPTVLQAIGYKELFPYFAGEISLEEAAEKIKQGTRRYAKRQLTWFRKEENIEFFYLDEMDRTEALEKAVMHLKEKAIWKAGIL